MEDYWTECQYYDIVGVCFMFGNCNHCCFCCGHPCTMLGVSLFISGKNKIQGFPGGAVVENLPANAGDTGLSPGLGRSHMPRSN